MMPTMAPDPICLTTDPRTARVIAFYESLSLQTLNQLETVYSEDARFIDPFNDVASQLDIRRVFVHMFASLDTPRFEVLQAVTEADHCFLLWNFHFRRTAAAAPMLIHGASHLRFASDGRVDWHRDHWDSSRELYEKLPLLGPVLRWLRRRLSAGR